jgi:hypothetical protein
VRRRPHGQWMFRECPIIIYNNRPARPSPQYLSGRWVKKAWPVRRKRAGAASAGSVAVIASAVRRLSIVFSPVLWPGPSQPVNADKSASQSKPAAALPTNSSASRQYTRSISMIDLCRVWSQILSKETPRFTALVTSPDRRLVIPNASKEIEKDHPPDDLCASRFARPAAKNCRLRRPWPFQSFSMNVMAIN